MGLNISAHYLFLFLFHVFFATLKPFFLFTFALIEHIFIAPLTSTVDLLTTAQCFIFLVVDLMFNINFNLSKYTFSNITSHIIKIMFTIVYFHFSPFIY